MEDFLAVVPKARCGFLYAGRHISLNLANRLACKAHTQPCSLQACLMGTLAQQQQTT